MLTDTQFTPVSALLGGGLIGLSALMLMAGNGRIAGISGILGGVFEPSQPDGAVADRTWRLAFIAGLVIAPLLFMAFAGPIEAQLTVGPVLLALAGLLVGLGTQMGSGCTSGHGVCGLSRFSLRAAIATGSFMITGALTVWVIRHGLSA